MGKAATSSAAGIAASGVALAGVAAAAVQLGAELSSTLGIIAAVPAAIGGMVAATATLKLALQGVGEAFGAALGGDATKFQESLKGLSPAAAQTARDLRTLKPAFDGLQQAVQQSFFGPLVGQLQQLSGVITGPLQTGMTKLAALFGEAASQLVQFASSAQGTKLINAIFTNTRKAVSALVPAIGQVVKGFASLATAGSSTLPQMAQSIARVASAFGQWLQQISASGQAVSWIQGAMTTFGQLGRIVMNLGATTAAVFGQITSSGNKILPMLVQATAAMRRFFTSAQGGKAVTATFNAIMMAVRLLKVPLRLLGVIFQSVLLPAIRGVMPILRTLAAAVFPMLTKAIQLIRPLFVQLGASFRKVLAAVAPVVQQIVSFLTPAFQRLVPVVQTVVSVVVSVVKGLFNAISNIFKLIGAVMRGDWSAAWDALKGILTSAWHVIWSILRGAVQTVWSIIKNLGPLLMDAFTGAWNLAKNAVTAGIDAVVGFVREIPGKITDVLSGLGNLLYGIGKDILQGLWDGLKSAWNAVSGWLGNIGGWIKNLKGPPSYDRRLLIPAGEAIMNGLDQGLRDGYSRVRRTLAGITTDIPSVQVPVSMGSPGQPGRVQPRPIGAGRGRDRGGGVAAGASAGAAGGGSSTTVHAPITVTTPATDPEIVARKTADRLARAAQA
ncbi:phage-related protein [Saccharopolyspora lacisalsi]|uniref:Phage-related protein n=2 Tax=Halosaccharopolyspora lacisalsi TaxID=1000566 RepID=A0A839E4Y4_9PSEU|nr:phage-related protein [Halosaccharopolyspora lacisalsi]